MDARVIIVTPDTVGPVKNGGVGTACFHYARSLANAGAEIDLLFTGLLEAEETAHWRKWYAGMGIRFLTMHDMPTRPKFAYGTHWYTDRSYRIFKFLEGCNYDYVLFQDWHANGLWSIRAKKMGYALHQTTLGVISHSPNAWQKAGMKSFGESPLNEADLEWCERAAIEDADVLVSPSHHMIKWLQDHKYPLPKSIAICPYTNEDEVVSGKPDTVDRSHLIFFGRIETRKGMHLLGAALRSLAKNGKPLPKKVSLLGKMASVDGIPTEEYLAALQADIPEIEYYVETNFDYRQAIDYISSSNGVVVIASILDNYPLTVLESILNGFCFIASQAGGIPEMVDPKISFPATADGLEKKLLELSQISFAGLQHPYTQLGARAQWLSHVQEVVNAARAKAASPRVSVTRNEVPPISIVTPFYKHDAYLPRLIRSFLSMRLPKLQFVVINDGTNLDDCPNFVRLKEALSPSGHIFHTQTNSGPGAARNLGIEMAEHDLIAFCDADNVPMRDMLLKLWQAMSLTNADSVAAPFAAVPPMYRNPIPEDVWFHFHPVGGSLEMAFFENTLADLTSLVKRDAILAIGGFGTERQSWEDWEFFVRLVGAGYKHYVYPEPLIYYTHDPNGRNETASDYENRISLFKTLEKLPPERSAQVAQIFAQQILLQRQTQQ